MWPLLLLLLLLLQQPTCSSSLPLNSLRADDVFVSVKTTAKFHSTRLELLIKTWIGQSKEHVWVFTDAHDQEINARIGGHLVVTKCDSSHSRQALSCKMQQELQTFASSDRKWFCHFDDDNYVHVAALLSTLNRFDPDEDWYLGKPSIPEPITIVDRNNKEKSTRFQFGTGGAGFCLSRPVAVTLAASDFASVADRIRLPDDVTIGYLSEVRVGATLTSVADLHSHLEPLRLIDEAGLRRGISFSYGRNGDQTNVVQVEGFSRETDPTRFLSLHCLLNPHVSWCDDHNNNSNPNNTHHP